MTNSNHSLWSTTSLLIVSMAATGASAPTLAHAAIISQADQQKIEIRKEEEQRLKEQDTLSTNKAKALAKQYEETAKLVASQGGDPKPLLDAAAHFADQSK